MVRPSRGAVPIGCHPSIIQLPLPAWRTVSDRQLGATLARL
jgi:hypothetical protein